MLCWTSFDLVHFPTEPVQSLKLFLFRDMGKMASSNLLSQIGLFYLLPTMPDVSFIICPQLEQDSLNTEHPLPILLPLPNIMTIPYKIFKCIN